MVVVRPYQRKDQVQWDKWVKASKNGTFLLSRGYMEYHADRFRDHSLMFFEDKKLIAVLPANIDGDRLISHGGLTYGGIVSDGKMHLSRMIEIFTVLVDHARSLKLKYIIYKSIPLMYHRFPAQEDLYALSSLDAKLCRRDASATLLPEARMPYERGRRGHLKSALKSGVQVRQSQEFSDFMKIVEENLMREHGRHAVHTGAEMEMLAKRFPENIKLFMAHRSEKVLGGVLVYETELVAHSQYGATTMQGKQASALDVVYDYLIGSHYQKKTFFDFGISTEREGKYLNEGLMGYKESYGARTTVYDFYEITL